MRNVMAVMFSSLFYLPSAFALVNDATAKTWVAASILGKAPKVSEIQPALDAVYTYPTVHDAWGKLKACRDRGNSSDLDLAAAEHYLFARYLATKLGDT